MNHGSLAFVIFMAAGCGGKVEPDYERAVPSAPPRTVQLPARCADQADPPDDLECTGLYSDLDAKELAEGVREYKPAVPLWADNAEKRRFIQIPRGEKIDASDPSEWLFPIGTKVWKEFSLDGKRMETRLFEKMPTTKWLAATYGWNDDDSSAPRSYGGDVPAPKGGTYYIPKQSDCTECHKGRSDRILGFEQVSLGLPGAEGVTLADLVSDGLISPEPERTTYEIGDDGTGLAAGPLAWMHINCGTTCHNDNTNATAFGATMRLRLRPDDLDGRSATSFESYQTLVGVTVNTPTFFGRKRVVPGDPNSSLVVQLITTRKSAADPNAAQMPPIATRIVDVPDSNDVIAWISKIPQSAGADPSSSGGVTNGNGPVR